MFQAKKLKLLERQESAAIGLGERVCHLLSEAHDTYTGPDDVYTFGLRHPDLRPDRHDSGPTFKPSYGETHVLESPLVKTTAGGRPEPIYSVAINSADLTVREYRYGIPGKTGISN